MILRVIKTFSGPLQTLAYGLVLLLCVSCGQEPLEQGRRTLEIGDHYRAAQIFSDYLDKEPLNREARYGLALSLYSEAQQEFEEGSDKDSLWLLAQRQFQILENLQQKYPETVEREQQELIQQMHSYALFQMARSEEMTEHYARALTYVRRALEKDSSFHFAWNLEGVCYYRLGQKEQAIHSISKAIALDSSFSSAYLNLGQIYEYYGDFEDAWYVYLEGLKHQPEHSALQTRAEEMEKILEEVLRSLGDVHE
jgi:tetratricopeptide (TPR) repeat protein